MAIDKNNIKIDHDLQRLGTDEVVRDVAHILCEAGSFDFTFNGKTFSLKAQECMIITVQKLLEHQMPSADLKVRCIYISPEFIEVCTPKNNYGIKGSLQLFSNPIMPLSGGLFVRMKRDFDYMEYRLAETDHLFQEDVMIGSTQVLFLDFYDVHAKLYDKEEYVSEQNASLISRFMALLEEGSYIKNRDVAYYADKLFVTPKYLSEVCKGVSGHPANYWITRFTVIHIRRLLKTRDMTFTEIAELFDFSSLAYFSRFVQKHLGMPPSYFRE